MDKGYLVLESGQVFAGRWHGGPETSGEVVFNTGHSGYEEMATDPSYFSQILITTAPMQGNYGEDDRHRESERMWIRGFVCLEMQNSSRDHSWEDKLISQQVPILSQLDTREIVLTLREQGTTWGALLSAESEEQAVQKASSLISKGKGQNPNWPEAVTCKQAYELKGKNPAGPKFAVIDFGCKLNTLRELQARGKEVKVFPCTVTEEEIRNYEPDGIMLSNGPGDPSDVQHAVGVVKSLLGWRYIFGICMGHQVLAQALGGSTYKLKFGHRGSNHPIKDSLLGQIYMTSQNHGYAVERDSLPDGVEVKHINLNDHTVAGIKSDSQKCMSVQFHPESHPGPHDAVPLFDFFVKQVQ
ncbi:MAG: glutamine-hydrolyzing carbamoyl-phosphate synthase small subunit [Bdellovibrionales bacterium]|nr:glutamine-hydrolyzing carbamoyl-phosphate synthase small subunit [Bdellovibrionales bacterium]